MKKPIIALDVDDVLSSTAQTIIDYGNKKWGHSHTIHDFDEKLADMWRVDPEEGNRRWTEFMNSGHLETLIPIPEARLVLENLRSSYTFIAVTSRRESLIGITELWLDRNYPGIISEVHSAGIYGRNLPDAHLLTKADKLVSLGADFLIDDQPKHCIGATEAGIQSILFGGYPWQTSVTVPNRVAKCGNWRAVANYFEAKR